MSHPDPHFDPENALKEDYVDLHDVERPVKKSKVNLANKSSTNKIRKLFGDNFVAKLKSERRFAFRDFRKEMGRGSASFRRYKKSSSEAKAKALKVMKK